MDILNSICSAVMTHYNSLDSSKKFNSGLYFCSAPQETTGDYVVFDYDGGSTDEYMGGADDAIQLADLRFSLFTTVDDGGFTLSKMIDNLTDSYDWRDIKIDGFQDIKFQRTGNGPVLCFDGIWQTTILYEVMFIKGDG